MAGARCQCGRDSRDLRPRRFRFLWRLPVWLDDMGCSESFLAGLFFWRTARPEVWFPRDAGKDWFTHDTPDICGRSGAVAGNRARARHAEIAEFSSSGDHVSACPRFCAEPQPFCISASDGHVGHSDLCAWRCAADRCLGARHGGTFLCGITVRMDCSHFRVSDCLLSARDHAREILLSIACAGILSFSAALTQLGLIFPCRPLYPQCHRPKSVWSASSVG